MDLKPLLLSVGIIGAFCFTSCLTINAKKIVEAPYVPEVVEGVQNVEVEKFATAYFSKDSIPEIDGNFAEWSGLEGVHTRKQIYGGTFNPKNADGFFTLRTDGENLYIYADITDDDAGINTNPAPQAWRADSIEFFFGTDTKSHSTYKDTDVRVRIIPRSFTDIFDVGIGINDEETENPDIKVAYVFTKGGYKVEGKFPLSVLGGKMLKNGQKFRADFQINDADGGKERTGLLHWNSGEDNTYANPGSWGNGKVISLPQE